VEEFLIGTGIALLLALLGWSEQIKSWHKDTMETEKAFCEERNINWSQIRQLIRTDAPAVKKLKVLGNLLKIEALTNIQDVNLIGEFMNLDKKRSKLEDLYKIKYKLVLIMTFLFLLSGIINYFVDERCKIETFIINIPTEFIPICICVLFSIGLLCFNTYLTSIESKYKDELLNLMEKI